MRITKSLQSTVALSLPITAAASVRKKEGGVRICLSSSIYHVGGGRVVRRSRRYTLFHTHTTSRFDEKMG